MPNNTDLHETRKTVVVFHEMTPEEEVQEIARLKEKWDLDERSALGNARRRGIEEGRKEAIEKMRRSGMTEEQIQKILNS